MRETERSSVMAVRAASAALGALTLALLSPGLVGPDEADMLRQAETGAFHDWHSPLIAWLWRLGLQLWPGTGSIQAVITLSFFLGIGLLAEAAVVRGHRAAGWLLICLSVFPPTWSALAAAGSKDVLTTALLLIAIGALARWPGRLLLSGGIALVALLLAMQVRPNAVFAAMPVVGLIAWRCSGGVRRRARLGLTAGLAILTVPALLLLAVAIKTPLGIERSHVLASLFLFDLTGITAGTGEDASDGLLGGRSSQETAECYTPLHWDTLAPWGRCPEGWSALFGDSLFAGPDGPDRERRLRDAWIAAILDHPLAYARHRLAHFAYATGLGAEPLGPMAWVELPALGRPGLDSIDRAASILAELPVFQPYAVLLLGAFGLLGLALLRGAGTPAGISATLLASGLTYGLAYLIVGVASNLRYFHWPVIAVAAGYVWLAAALAASRTSSALPDPALPRPE